MKPTKNPKHTREQELIKRARTDERAFRELYDFYLPKIYGFILRRIGQKEAAEDLTSEVFLKAFANLDKYEDRGFTFGSWIFRIAANSLIDHYRRQAGKVQVELEAASGLADTKEVGEGIEAEENRKFVEQCLNYLSEKERKVVELKFYGELSNIEIAEAVGLSANNIGVIIYRALKKMKDNI